MDRMEEYEALLQEPEELPPAGRAAGACAALACLWGALPGPWPCSYCW